MTNAANGDSDCGDSSYCDMSERTHSGDDCVDDDGGGLCGTREYSVDTRMTGN